MPHKKPEEKFAKVIFAKKNFSKNRESFFQVPKTKIKKGSQKKCRNSLVLMYAFKTDNETNFLKMLR